MTILLSRDVFREAVFKRDGHACVICKKTEAEVGQLDAHHILDRKLFPDGGYYLSNGATLCSEHHIEAEKCDLTVEEIRHAAGITEVILPPGLLPGIIYDKWGQEVDEGIISRKYGRTYHLNFSPGTTSDDRIAHDYWNDVKKIDQLVITEKLDGENNCLSEHGVFARSHASTTESRWTQDIRQRWQSMKYDLKGGVQIFLENLYAIHSIEYRNIDHHYYVFAVRENGRCAGWDEVKFWADSFDLPTVPVLQTVHPSGYLDEAEFKNLILNYASKKSDFDSYNHVMSPTGELINEEQCTREGIVIANVNEYLLRNFDKNVFKYVRAKHVKTDEHWTRNWKRAKLNWERVKV